MFVFDIMMLNRSILRVAGGKGGVLPTVFKWEKGGKDVSICGTFTQWKPIQMVKSHGDFVIILDVPEGEHEYRFKVDGHWHLDETEPTVEAEEGQSKNNVIKVCTPCAFIYYALYLHVDDTF